MLAESPLINPAAAATIAAEPASAREPSLRETLNFGARIEVGARSLMGNQLPVRRENEDNFVLVDATGRAVWMEQQAEVSTANTDWTPGHVRLAMLDGLGGHGLGREVAETIARHVATLPPFVDVEAMSEALDILHSEIFAEFANRGTRGHPAATLIVLDIPPQGDALLFHVGDSRLYRVPLPGDTPVEQLTIDHVEATTAYRVNKLSLEAWRDRTQYGSGAALAQAFGCLSTLDNPAEGSMALCRLRADDLPAAIAHLEDRRALKLDPDAVYFLGTDGWWATTESPEWLARWPALLNQPGRPMPYALDDLVTELLLHPPADLKQDNTTAIAFRLRPQSPTALTCDQTFVSAAPGDTC